MNLKLNPIEKRLKDALMVLPPDFEAAERLLSREEYTVDNISIVGTDFVWGCVEECWNYFWENEVVRNENVIPNLHSTYLCDVLTLLLRYGLDPNAAFEEENIMDNLKYLDNGYMAADALVLLFEHGGNPNLIYNGPSILGFLFCSNGEGLTERLLNQIESSIRLYCMRWLVAGKQLTYFWIF